MERNKWYKDKVFYQIWPRSFKDGNGDGNCDECGYVLAAPAAEGTPEEEKVSFPFWIPIVAAVIIATGGLFIATGKKSR